MIHMYCCAFCEYGSNYMQSMGVGGWWRNMGHSFGFSGLRRSSGFHCQNESRTAVSLRFLICLVLV